jgi:hypothetical protein
MRVKVSGEPFEWLCNDINLGINVIMMSLRCRHNGGIIILIQIVLSNVEKSDDATLHTKMFVCFFMFIIYLVSCGVRDKIKE